MSRKLPRSAFEMRATVGAAEMAENAPNSPAAPRSPGKRVKIVARSPGPVMAPNIDNGKDKGPVIHDLAGVFFKDRFPLDYQHDPKCILGFCDGVEVTDLGLAISGVIIPFKEDDLAAKVSRDMEMGFPYEASIYFPPSAPGDVVIEDVDAGEEAEVNGQSVSGPCTIIRRWPLRGVAIVPYGMDSATVSAAMSSMEQGQYAVMSISEAKARRTEGEGMKKDESVTHQVAMSAGEKPEEKTADAQTAKPDAPSMEANPEAKPEVKPDVKKMSDEEIQKALQAASDEDAKKALVAEMECRKQYGEEVARRAAADAKAAAAAAAALVTAMTAEFSDEAFAARMVAAGKDIAQARVEYTAQLRSENAQLKQKVADLERTVSEYKSIPPFDPSRGAAGATAYSKLTESQRKAVDAYCAATIGADKERLSSALLGKK